MSKELTLTTALEQAKVRFNQANELQLVKWSQESGYVSQALRNNAALSKCSPESIRDAVINVAAIGISLNPAQKMAYLVPRDGRCCLDISYMGLIKLATDTGSIQWAKAALVYAADVFKYLGPTQLPIHEADPFTKERGDIVGVYCVAKTAGGDILTETMSLADILDVQACSKAASGPWKTFFGEMAKKTVIKRASKTWPKTDKSIRLERAIEMLNQHEGLTDDRRGAEVVISPDEVTVLRSAIEQRGIEERTVLRALGIVELEHLPAASFDSAMALISGARAA